VIILTDYENHKWEWKKLSTVDSFIKWLQYFFDNG